MAADTLQGIGARGVVHAYIRLSIAFFGKHRSLIRQVYLKSRTTSDAAYVARTKAFNAEAHGMLRDRLLERRAEIHHPDPDRACTFAVMMVSAAMRATRPGSNSTPSRRDGSTMACSSSWGANGVTSTAACLRTWANAGCSRGRW